MQLGLTVRSNISPNLNDCNKFSAIFLRYPSRTSAGVPSVKGRF